ncbi:DNA adenine methylase [Candidatus Spongiihabitans sp.]|uniref:DNA adenine methylase n=1 Tax=Candidatus Spongiihabitans sp. TaxID=3101308 RepID=UPI003C7D5B6C
MIVRNITKPIDVTLEQVSELLIASTPTNQPRRPTLKSPLRYPGGKSRAVKQILHLLPPNLDRLCSPFVGGGSVELACAARGVEVHAYDAFAPLVNFWQVLLEDAPKLAQLVRAYHPLNKVEFYALQRGYFTLKGRRKLAAVFFALNRSSFSGTTLSGGMSPGHPRFTDTAIVGLAAFKTDRLTIKQADFKQSLGRHKHDFLYLDPPYVIASKLYGKRGDHHADFDHAALAKILRKRDGWLLSYNDCPAVRELYDGFCILSSKWAYGMNASRQSNEVFVLSADYANVFSDVFNPQNQRGLFDE